MAHPELTNVIERIVLAGVAITARALSNAGGDLDLTLPQWRALLVVGENPAGATVTEVSIRVGVTVPATSRQLRRLARRGLLETGPDEHDRRATRVRLSDRGAAVRDAILRERTAAIAAVADGVEVAPATARDLERLAKAFDAYR